MSLDNEDLDFLATALRRTVRSEIRVAAILDQPATLSTIAHEPDVEDGLIAAAREGHIVEGVDPRDFYGPLHAHVWIACVEAKRLGLQPTTDMVCEVFERDGWSGSGLREEVERLFDHVGICRPDMLAVRLKRLARLRRISALAVKLDALCRAKASESEVRSAAKAIVDEVKS